MPSSDYPQPKWDCLASKPVSSTGWVMRVLGRLGLPVFRRVLRLSNDGFLSDDSPGRSGRLTPIDSFVWTWVSGVRLRDDAGVAFLVVFFPAWGQRAGQCGAVRRWLMTLPSAKAEHDHP